MTRTATALRCAEVALVATAVAATVPAYRDLFATGSYLVPLLTVAGAGILLAVLTAAARLWAPITLVFALAGFLIAAGHLMLPETMWHGIPTTATLSAVHSGLVDGWVRTLTTAQPAKVSPDLLLTPAILVYFAGFTATTVALRTRALLTPVPLPLLPLMAALLLTAGPPSAALPVSAVVLSSMLILVLVRATRLDSAAGGPHVAGQARFGLPMAVLVAAAGIAATHLVPIGFQGRFDPLDFVRARLTVPETVTPLALVRSQMQEIPPRKLFTVRVSGPAPDRIRTAALDTYDGTLWTSEDRFLAAGHDLAAAPGPKPAAEVTLRVDITELDQPYLPATGWPDRIDGDGIRFCATSGVLAAATTRPAKLHYELVAGVQPLDAGVRSADPAPAAGRYLSTPPSMPSELSQAAWQLTAGARTPYAKLEALERGLRGLPYALDSRPGHSVERLAGLFSGDQGYAEQHAAAFAVMARSLGFPARVATGYRLRPAADGVYTVRTSDAWAWAEVDLAGYGWVAFDPTDPRNHQRIDPPVQPQPATGGGEPSPGPAGTTRLADAQPPHPGPGAPARPDGPPLVLAALLSLPILVPALVVSEKLRRYRRRRRGSPAERIAGAWRQSTDRLREAGLPIQRSWTALETAERARARVGAAAAPVELLAPMVGAVCYGVRPPDPATADQAWQADSALRTALRRERGTVATLLAWLNPRPLLRRRV